MVRVGPIIILLILFVGLAAIIVWIADWMSGGRRYTALAVLNRRFAGGEIDEAEYEEKRKLITRQRRWYRPRCSWRDRADRQR